MSLTSHHVNMADELGQKDDILAGLDFKHQDPAESKAILSKLVKKREEEKKAQAKREKQRLKHAQAAAAAAVEDDDASADAIAKMAELQEKLGLDTAALLEEYQETQQVLVPVLMPPEPVAAADPDYMEGVTSALGALGVDASFLAGAEGASGEPLEAVLLEEGVRCGFVQHEALRLGSLDAPAVDSLFQLLSRSRDTEVAGAAFVTLLSALGDPQLPHLLLDSAYGLPPDGSPIYASLPRPCTVDSLPTVHALYEALQANGYSPGQGQAVRGKPPRQQQQQQQQAAGASPSMDLGGGGAGGAEGSGEGEQPTYRIQAVKLVLQTAAAVCRYCQQHPRMAGACLDRESLADLCLAVAHLGLDPRERLLLNDLDGPLAALLGAFEEGDWGRKLAAMAARLGELAHSHTAHLRLLKRLPASTPRGLALQQLSAAQLLEKLIPTKGTAGGGGRGAAAAARRRDGGLDPTAVIAAQPWFDNPKALVSGATSGNRSSVPKGGYHITQLDLLLTVCHLLLWPHMARYSEGAQDTPLTPQFLQRWCGHGGFLEKLQRSVKQVDEDAYTVKSHAGLMESEYKEAIPSED